MPGSRNNVPHLYFVPPRPEPAPSMAEPDTGCRCCRRMKLHKIRKSKDPGVKMGRFVLLWLLGIPLPILLIIWILGGFH
jgi:hypothetical protein